MNENQYVKSDTRQRFITILNSISVYTEEHRAGFTIGEITDFIPASVSERTVRRCIEDLRIHGFVVKRDDGLYYAQMTLQPSIFHK